MQAISRFRRLAPVVVVIVLSVLVASCSGTKKYGCPNKLQASSVIR